jgi:hypothetical protein
VSSTSTKTREIRKFGLVALVFFGCLCGLEIWKQKVLPTYVFGLLSVLGLGFILFPGPLRPVHAAWLKVAHRLGKIITGLTLALAYYLVITPAALLKRVFGGRPLPLKPDRDAESYWIPRDEPAQPKERFLRRY